MGFLADTSAIIELERGEVDVSELATRAGSEPVHLSAIGWAELLAGVHLVDTPQRALARRRKLEALKAQMNVLPFTSDIAEVWAEAFAELQRAGIPISANDLAIAATALHHRLTLLVGRKDEAHFRRIKGLKVECLPER